MSIQVLFVCLGNICRSPTAHGVFQQKVAAQGLANHIAIDSAGTGDWHIGEPPDQRTMAAAHSRGYDLSALRARQVSAADFSRFDFILAMDRSNLADLRRMCPPAFTGELELFLRYAPAAGVDEVPDPYYGGEQGFERVLELVEDASDGLLSRIQRTRL